MAFGWLSQVERVVKSFLEVIHKKVMSDGVNGKDVPPSATLKCGFYTIAAFLTLGCVVAALLVLWRKDLRTTY